MTNNMAKIGLLSNHSLRFIRKCSPALKLRLEQQLLELPNRLDAGKALSGDLAKLRVIDIRYRGQAYRVAFIPKLPVQIVLIGSRENFYQKLRRILK